VSSRTRSDCDALNFSRPTPPLSASSKSNCSSRRCSQMAARLLSESSTTSKRARRAGFPSPSALAVAAGSITADFFTRTPSPILHSYAERRKRLRISESSKRRQILLDGDIARIGAQVDQRSAFADAAGEKPARSAAERRQRQAVMDVAGLGLRVELKIRLV